MKNFPGGYLAKASNLKSFGATTDSGPIPFDPEVRFHEKYKRPRKNVPTPVRHYDTKYIGPEVDPTCKAFKSIKSRRHSLFNTNTDWQ